MIARWLPSLAISLLVLALVAGCSTVIDVLETR